MSLRDTGGSLPSSMTLNEWNSKGKKQLQWTPEESSKKSLLDTKGCDFG